MSRLDAVLGAAAVLLFAAYMSVLIWKVPSPALIVVSSIGILMAVFDIVRSYGRRRSGPARRG